VVAFCCLCVFDLTSLTKKTVWYANVFTLVWLELTLQHDAIGLSLDNSSIFTFILTSNYAHINMKQNGREKKMINHTMFHNKRLHSLEMTTTLEHQRSKQQSTLSSGFYYMIGPFDFSTNRCSLFEVFIFIFVFFIFIFFIKGKRLGEVVCVGGLGIGNNYNI
jgi:hypothetical protein